METEKYLIAVHPDGREEIRTDTGESIALRVGVGDAGRLTGLSRVMLAVRTTPPEGQVPWMPRARAWLAESVARMEEAADGRVLAVWPCAGDVVSDVPSTLAFLREHRSWRLVLEPQAIITREMLPTAEDHLGRIVEVLGGHPSTVGIVLGGGALGEVEERLVRSMMRPGVWLVQRDGGRT